MTTAILLNLLQIILLIPISLAVLYIFVFALAGLFYKQEPYPVGTCFRKIAVMIPGYKEDEVILEVAQHSLNQDYPIEFYDVIIIADSFLPETIVNLKMLNVKVIEVAFDKSTKSKALNKAMSQLPGNYEIAVILDADNIMADDFLSKINAAFDRRFTAYQGHRTAKNMDTPLAVLDAVSEAINNHIFRKGHRVLGLSSAIIGSGMAFPYPFFRELMAGVTAIGGFDKEIELKMLKEGHKIEFLDDAVVYDEKVSKAEAFSNQRRRWLSAQLVYFRQDFVTGLKELFRNGNIDYFEKVIQFIQPPRILLLGLLLVLCPLFIIINLKFTEVSPFIIWWITALSAGLLAFIFSIPRKFYNFATLKAILHLPAGMILMLGSLLKIKGANRQFIHTKHSSAKGTHN